MKILIRLSFKTWLAVELRFLLIVVLNKVYLGAYFNFIVFIPHACYTKGGKNICGSFVFKTYQPQ